MLNHEYLYHIMRTHDASWVLMLHHENSWCIMSTHDASWVLIMHHEYSVWRWMLQWYAFRQKIAAWNPNLRIRRMLRIHLIQPIVSLDPPSGPPLHTHRGSGWREFKTNSFKILSWRYEKTQPLTRILCFWARKLGSELTPNGIIWLQINFW